MSRPRKAIVLAAIVLGFTAAAQSCVWAAGDPTPPGWLTYVNTRYDFDICYSPQLHPQPEAAAGDGQVFKGPGGGTLTVFWRPGTAGDTPAKTVDGEVAGLGASPTVTYTAKRGNWAVRSGKQADQLFYVKAIQRDGDTLIMDVSYPASGANIWNAMVGHFAACFESSRPTRP